MCALLAEFVGEGRCLIAQQVMTVFTVSPELEEAECHEKLLDLLTNELCSMPRKCRPGEDNVTWVSIFYGHTPATIPAIANTNPPPRGERGSVCNSACGQAVELGQSSPFKSLSSRWWHSP
ncbi:hypothetical protein, variant 7 [Aphanomyces astaci]|uniref:Uncharacterized protein n=1 Tax=Aphanomyces astaci TaxID=112090 RepID=W4GER8_APHAT|nr:hypothetical protein, variant 4 [Aphanomyces astaci]XP_009832524.1 hypothetical protein, variant 5 [Aphanomyces astaci]XP_009832525.1 hypothetical protein, variant 6 [Aphanomyces astaci]XP_009832526.1 hypothetical protein, variant 7 [Aphanomyces astaci]ETV78186.1 hypothetical protein, variant 4 [Aphanomyces astaci]ETV78187.1 hypothetical protein, variant 5 [Aphanomyces astaci]ETV78188.1 hypothetical protein, variant 6 [Aphanomyces astaci]ETV78189.1 hypothetical protein, variant 7 [Aphanom|eukprot:XP_009832523.1 hypothetical protein, variant 4 [Aphanomyces astaci]